MTNPVRNAAFLWTMVAAVFLVAHLAVSPTEAFVPASTSGMKSNHNRVDQGVKLQSQIMSRHPSSSALKMLPQESVTLLSDNLPSMLTAVTVFSGSSVGDAVVVSNAFWDGLGQQLVTLLIANVVAAIVFGLVATLAKDNITKLGDFAAEKVFGDDKVSGLRQPPPGYDGSSRVTPDFNKLAGCLVIDMIGTSSGLVPIIGGLTDVIWAPIAALLVRSLYGSNVVFALEFAEEVLPFTDILPLATLWYVARI